MKPMSLMAITAFVLTSGAVAQTQGYSASQNQPSSQAQGQQAAPSDSSSTSGTTSSTDLKATPSGTAAGTSSTATTTTPTTTSGSTATTSSPSTQAPAPTVVEQKVDLKTEPGPPADLRAARQEAVNALAWAKSEGCRSDPSPRECVRHAQDEYRQTMARLGNGGRAGGTVSASGTSAAGTSDARRADRN